MTTFPHPAAGHAARAIHGASAQGWWLAVLAGGGFAVPVLGSAWLHLPRPLFLLPYVLLAAVFAAAYLRWDATPVRAELRRRWAWGVLAAALTGGLTGAFVLRWPASPSPGGAAGLLHVLWEGVVYGGVDALLLTVLPVWMVWRAFRVAEAPGPWGRTLVAGAVGLAASAAVTAAYHLGYPEFRGAVLAGPIIGNTLFTLAYLLTRSPLAPLGGHIAMHVATVLFAFHTAPTLPPHY